MALPQRYVEKDRYTQEEYLRWEQDAPHKSEYVRGDIRAISGGTDYHGALALSIGAELRAVLKGRDCLVMSSDMKLLTPRGSFRYPDVTVTCGTRRFHGRGRSVLTNPLLIVEVLSDSTSATDYGEKLREYQMLESLQHYLLVSQREPRIEIYTRKDDGHWDYLAVEAAGGVLPLSALPAALRLADIYDGIEFDPDAEEAS